MSDRNSWGSPPVGPAEAQPPLEIHDVSPQPFRADELLDWKDGRDGLGVGYWKDGRDGHVYVGDYRYPARFVIRVESRRYPAKVRMLVIANSEGRTVCVSLTCTPWTEDAGVTGAALRELPIGRFMDAGRELVSEYVERKGRGNTRTLVGRQMTEDERPNLAAAYDRGTTARRGVPVTREQIEDAARLYREAITLGQPPRQYVSQKLHISQSTAAKWFMRARRPGPHGEPPLLGPAMRGRAGEQKEDTE